MSPSEWFFLACAVIGGAVFLIWTVLSLTGLGDHGALGDVTAGDFSYTGHASDGGFNTISLQGISAFALMFGLVGLAILRNGGATWLAYGGAIGVGVMTVWLISRMFKGMIKMQADGTLRIRNAIGQEGTVYLTIPDEGSGQVQVTVQGALRVLEARSANHTKIPTGERVRVVDIAGANILLVEQI